MRSRVESPLQPAAPTLVSSLVGRNGVVLYVAPRASCSSLDRTHRAPPPATAPGVVSEKRDKVRQHTIVDTIRVRAFLDFWRYRT